MADLSSVVSFFAFAAPRPGSSTSCVLGFRGPGRFPVEGVGAAGVDDAVLSTVVVVGSAAELDADADCDVSSCGRHIGHFFASGESSGTSTTSLTRI